MSKRKTTHTDLSDEQEKLMEAVHLEPRRNDSLFDIWSLTHIAWGFLLCLWLGPAWAMILLILWEPFEVLVLSTLLKRYLNINFGFESLRNSLSDIVFDAVGVAACLLII